MDEKTLNNLSAAELRTLLLSQQHELEELRTRLHALQSQLDDRHLAVTEAGSIAQAALQLSGIFENAQQAADQYLKNVASINERKEADYQQRMAEAEQQAQALLQAAQRECRDLEHAARVKSDYYWDALSDKIACLYQQHPELLQPAEAASPCSAEDSCFGPDD